MKYNFQLFLKIFQKRDICKKFSLKSFIHYFFLGTMTIQQLKGIIQRSLKVQNVKQKLSYLDEKVIKVNAFTVISVVQNSWLYIELFISSFRIHVKLNLTIIWNSYLIIHWHLVMKFMFAGRYIKLGNEFVEEKFEVLWNFEIILAELNKLINLNIFKKLGFGNDKCCLYRVPHATNKVFKNLFLFSDRIECDILLCK